EEHCEDEEVAIFEAPGCGGGPGAGCIRSRDVAGGEEPLALGNEKEAALDAVRISPVEQPLRAAEPTLGLPELLPQREAEADPEGCARRELDVAGLEVQVVHALVGGNPSLVAAEHVRGRREQAEVGRAERIRLVGV